MIVLPAQGIGDYAMRFYNSDGSLGEMCGNGAPVHRALRL